MTSQIASTEFDSVQLLTTQQQKQRMHNQTMDRFKEDSMSSARQSGQRKDFINLNNSTYTTIGLKSKKNVTVFMPQEKESRRLGS